MHKLHGKRALVTAGAQGIGLAISRQLLAAGCEVFVHYRSSAAAAAWRPKQNHSASATPTPPPTSPNHQNASALSVKR